MVIDKSWNSDFMNKEYFLSKMQISLFAKLIAFFCLALFATYMELVTTKVKKVIPLSNQLPT